MTNKEEIYDLIKDHPEGLDDDDIAQMTGIQPRQQVQQLCNQLADSQRIHRHSVGKAGKRRKIHNFPMEFAEGTATPAGNQNWRRRLSALVAATVIRLSKQPYQSSTLNRGSSAVPAIRPAGTGAVPGG